MVARRDPFSGLNRRGDGYSSSISGQLAAPDVSPSEAGDRRDADRHIRPERKHRAPACAWLAAVGSGRAASRTSERSFVTVSVPDSIGAALRPDDGAQSGDPTGSYADEIDWIMGPTPDDAIRQLQPLIDLGVGLVTIAFHDRRTLDLFAREVIPAFR